MVTWTSHTFTRVLSSLRDFADAEPGLAAQARADFPKSRDAEKFPWMDMALAAWILHGREDAEGRTAADRRLLKEGSRLPRAERTLLGALAASWCSVFEVEEVRLGTGLRLRDLLLDETLEVRERNLTTQVVRHDVMVAWVIPAGDHLEVVGGPAPVPLALSAHLVADARQELSRQPPAADAEGRHRQVRRLVPFLCRRLMELLLAEPEAAEPPLSELLDALSMGMGMGPRRRAFQDAAGRRPRRPSAKAEAPLEPGAVYVFKLGPLEVGEDGRASIYAAVADDGEVLPPVVERKDAEGLGALARTLGKGPRYCEARLARTGAAFGYSARPMPTDIAKLRAALAVHMYWGPEARDFLPPALVEELLSALSDLIREEPWETWTNEEPFTVHLDGDVKGTRELSVMGNGGQEFGFALFDRAGSVERMALSAPPWEGVDVIIPDSLGLTLEDEPAWAVKAIQQVTGLPFVPELTRVQRNTPRLPTLEEVLVTAAVAKALASAPPEEREARAELRVDGRHVRVRLEIPLPLFSGMYVGKALPAKSAPRPVPSKPARRKVPTRKVSETLLEFARPLLGEVDSSVDPQDELFETLALALTAWNAVVQDTWEPEKGQVERARAALRRMPKDDREVLLPDFDRLVERKRRHFAEDPRLFDALDVIIDRHGGLGVRLMGLVTPGAWGEFLGA